MSENLREDTVKILEMLRIDNSRGRIKQIANELGMSYVAVKQQVFRLRNKGYLDSSNNYLKGLSDSETGLLTPPDKPEEATPSTTKEVEKPRKTASSKKHVAKKTSRKQPKKVNKGPSLSDNAVSKSIVIQLQDKAKKIKKDGYPKDDFLALMAEYTKNDMYIEAINLLYDYSESRSFTNEEKQKIKAFSIVLRDKMLEQKDTSAFSRSDSDER